MLGLHFLNDTYILVLIKNVELRAIKDLVDCIGRYHSVIAVTD